MNLRDKLNRNSRIEDLDVLLEEPFEIDAENDFPLMYVINYNIRVKHRFDSLRGLNLPDEQKDPVERALHYDYSPSYKIILSYLYHKLAQEGFSKQILQDVKKMRKGVLFSMQGMQSIPKIIPPEVCERIWSEFSQYPQLKQDFYSARTRLKKSPENERISKVVDSVSYDLDRLMNVEFAKGNPGCIDRNPRLNYIPKGINPELWSEISLRGRHDFGGAISHAGYFLTR